MTLFYTNAQCVKCGKLVVDGEDVQIITTGRVYRVGGLGIYKGELMFKGVERIEHVRACEESVWTCTTCLATAPAYIIICPGCGANWIEQRG